MDRCRLCLSEDFALSSVSEIREGLPISVISMIICPVKIEASDNLPKQICDECLDLVLRAYKLRGDSARNEVYLKESLEYFEEPAVKQENLEYSECKVYAESFEASAESFEFKATAESSYNTLVPRSGDFKVELYNKSKGKSSIAWDYFGRLVDAMSGDEVVEGAGFNYCKLCVENHQILSKRYMTSNATSVLVKHVKEAHGIKRCLPDDDADSFNDVHQISIKTNGKVAEPHEVAPFSCDICGITFKKFQQIETHIIVAHKLKSNKVTSKSGDFRVALYNKSKGKTSIAWNFFGRLVDTSGDEVLEGVGFNYCKLCVENHQILSKRYMTSNATSVLVKHVKIAHGIKNYDVKLKSAPITSRTTFDPPSTEIVINSSGYGVNCYKASINRSLVWFYAGALVDSSGKVVQSENHNIFCKLCIEQDTMRRFSIDSATTNIMAHLRRTHKIDLQSKLPPGEASNEAEHEKSNEDDHPKAKLRRDLRRSMETKTCALCNEEFESRKAYWNHMRAQHKDFEPTDFICHVCSKSFTKNYILVKHMRIHEGKVHQCTKCPAKFLYPEGLKRHINIHDPSHLQKFQCDKCPKSYCEMKSLKKHMMVVHLDKPRARNFPCNHCDLKFFSRNNLRQHSYKHTGEKPHSCHLCDVAYASKGDLYKHLQRNHLGDALYNCSFEGCTASFRLRVELREHYRVHYEDDDKASIEKVNL